jgi:MarR family 2-MHQ and catechol resistance regulon transcriptional repressor
MAMQLGDELDLDMPFKDLLHEALLNIVRTADVLSKAGEELFRHHDLTEAQFNVIFSLKYSGRKMTQSMLGRRLVVTRASVTSVLDKLEAKGYVRRAEVPGNRRTNHVELTEKGRVLIDDVEPRYRAVIHDVMSVLTEDQVRSLMRSLESVRGRVHGLKL